MDEIQIIPVTKEFEQDKLVDAIIAYMSPNSERERIESKCVRDTYNISVLYQPNKKKDEWVQGRSVRLIFDEDTCKVGIYYQISIIKANNKKATEVTAGTAVAGVAAALLLTTPLAVPGIVVVAGAAVGADAVNAKKFKKDILKIVKSYVSDEAIEQKA